MNEPLNLSFAFVAGFWLGGLFFGGLWWTVQKAMSARTPATWFLGSGIVRAGVALSGFYFMARGHWDRLVMCFAGFMMARFLVMRLNNAS